MLRDSLKESGNSTDGVLVPLTAAALQHFNDKFKFGLVHKKVMELFWRIVHSVPCIQQVYGKKVQREDGRYLLGKFLLVADNHVMSIVMKIN